MADATWRKTACILCECNCGIEVELGGADGRQLVRFRGDKAHPASRGYACEKPHRLNYYQHARDRLTIPLRRRRDGGFDAISWETAIREVADRLVQVRDTHGGDAIFYYGGGGQGNHLPGAYATATRRVLRSRFRSSALAQEKTGEFWVSQRMLGTVTRGDFEHCEVGVFVGKNPWHSHSIARARVVLKQMARDPTRCLIVIDPRRTETAALADIHLQVRPGADAWLLAAMVAMLIAKDHLDHDFLRARAIGLESVLETFRTIPIAAYCERAGVDEALVHRAVERIANAESVASFEDLGVQMNRHSTVVSYLHRLLWLLTGNFGRPGTQYVPSPLVDLTAGSLGKVSPVVGARIVSGLVPCNVIPEEILTDHPARYRAMIVEAANPAHSLADSPRFREALRALDTLVVIDVVMSETARLADYVLPAATQMEKAEATFFNFEFPDNVFHLRPRLFPAPSGPLAEAEIHARLVEALGGVTEEHLALLREAAGHGLTAYAEAFMTRALGDPRAMQVAPVLLYRTLGPVLPEGYAEGAVLLALAGRFAMSHPVSLARAGFHGPPMVAATALFEAMLDNPSGFVFSADDWADVVDRLGTSDGKIHLALDDLLAEIAGLSAPDTGQHAEYPYVLSAGERRAFTANTIIRDPKWRKKDATGALRISLDDAGHLGVTTGDRVRVTTRRGAAVVVVEVSETMQAGHISLPNGLGTDYPEAETPGVAPNELTSLEDRDPFVGTPWHKHVPARLERA